MKKTISAIIPIFNEEKTVKKVVEAFLNSSGLIDEIICVNDGSTDRSLEILKGFGGKIKLINLKKNKCKGNAMAKGVEKAAGEFVVFFDADFVNLSPKYIRLLVEPVLKKNFKAALGIPMKHRSDIRNSINKIVTGQRVYMRKTLLPHLSKIKKTNLETEIFLNTLVEKKETKIVPLRGLTYLNKFQKRKLPIAIKEYLVQALKSAQQFNKLNKGKSILSKDIQLIKNLKEPVSLKKLKVKIAQIKNKEIKKILQNHIRKYFDKN